MTFAVVAASYQHRERERSAPYRTVMAGVTFGGVAVFTGFVGILTMFGQRDIIDGILSLAHLTLVMAAFFAGLWVTHTSSRADLVSRVAQGLGAGAVAGGLVSLLALAIHLFKLRRVFIALKKDLLDILTFDQHIGVAVAILILGGALCGLLGAALYSMPRKIRRPLVIGLTWAFFTGLFQELIQLMLQYEFLMKFREVFFTWDGLKLQGAFIVFGVATVASAVWQACRPRYDAFRENATPGQAKMLLGFKILIGLILIIGFPAFAGNFIGQVLMLVGLYVLMGMGLNLELGLAGLLDLGFVAFFAVGAYTTALLTSNADIAIANLSFWQALPIAVVLSVIIGVLFGIPVLKVRGDYLAVATLGLGEIVRVLVLSDFAAPVLGGAQGVLGIPRPSIGGFEFDDPIDLFYVTLAASAVAAYFAWRLENSRLGRAWTAIRDDEDVAQALGINLVNVKLLAYGLGAGFAGVAGSIFAVMLSSIFPHSFQLLISINVLALLIVGGMGSLPGVVVGAAALIGLPELLREFGEYRFLFYGLVIVVMMRIKAEGLWPSAARRRERMLEEESRAAIEAELRGEGAGR